MTVQRAVLSSSQRICLLLLGALGWLSFPGLPYEVTSLTTRFNLPGSAAGWVASAELLALAGAAALFGRSTAALSRNATNGQLRCLASLSPSREHLYRHPSPSLPLLSGLGFSLVAALG